MKLTIVLLAIFVLQVNANASAQDVSINVKNHQLKDVLYQLTKQTGYNFICSSEIIKDFNSVTLSVNKVPLKEALRLIFINQNVEIVFKENKTVIIKANQNQVSGKITDDNNEPLSGVSVKVKNTKIGTVSDNNGMYRINASEGSILVFSFMGFAPQEVSVKSNKVINVTLKELKTALDEIVVIGYGTALKRDITGAVSSVNIQDLTKAPVKSYDEALAGRIAGVQVTSNDGQPGSVPNIVIRGNNSLTQDNSPLYVVDGFPIEENISNSINPSEIESIEVLKDASASAIYGARGANGVIMITTKKGKGKTTLNYDTYFGMNQVIKRQEVLSPYEFVKYQLELSPGPATAMYLSDGNTLESYRDKKGVNWQDEILRTAPFQNHSLAIRGKEGRTNFSISGSVISQEGVIINSGFKRYQGRFVLDHELNKKLKVGINTNYSSSKSHGVKIADFGGSNSKISLLASAWGYRPTTQGIDENLVDLNLDPDVDPVQDYRYNPLKIAMNEVHEDGNKVLTINGYAQYTFNPYLLLRVSGGVNSSELEAIDFYSSNTRYGDINTPQGRNGPNGRILTTKVSNYLNENTLTYKRTFNKKHNLNLLGGFTVQQREYWRHGYSAASLPNENLGISGLDEGLVTNNVSIQSINTLASFLGRVNYNYRGKYYFTTSFRADGSSKFSPDNRWSYFPSAALSYRFTREPFMKKVKFLSDGKVRLSYGYVGNNRVSDFPYLSTIQVNRNADYSFGNVFYPGADLYLLGNYNLRWETTSTIDAGIDLEFLRGAVTLTVDYYSKQTFDLLLNAQMAGSTGYTSAFQNIGKVSNNGLEFELTSRNINKKNLSWSTSFNISFNSNKIKALQSGQSSLLSPVRWDVSAFRESPVYIAQVGRPIAMMYGYVFDGLYQESDFIVNASGGYTLRDDVQIGPNNVRPGSIKYKDLNGDGVVDTKDQTVIGNPNPLHFGGLSNNLSYKNFDLNIFFQWSYGNDIYNANRHPFEGTTSSNFNQFASVANRWTPTNTNTNIPAVNGQGLPMYSSRVIEDGSFLRLKTVQLGYNLPDKYLKAIKINKLRVYGSAQNLFTWTNYSGIDPEVSTYNSALTPGFDYSPYPRAKTIIFGLNVTL